MSLLFPGSILDTFQPEGLIFQCHICLPFHTVHGVLQQEYWSGLPFPFPVDCILSELSPMTCPSWVALHGMAHSFIEFLKPLHHNKAVIHGGDKYRTLNIHYFNLIKLKIDTSGDLVLKVGSSGQ